MAHQDLNHSAAGSESPAPGPKNEYFDPEFRVKANVLDPKDLENPLQDYIDFKNKEKCITMPGSKVHAGLPVDANLAVHFICNFFRYYQLRIKQHHEEFEEFFEKEDLNGMHTSFSKAKDLHDKIVNLTYGMTLERDMLLKILSQPHCEGIRFYLCGRMVKGGEGDGVVVGGSDSKEIHLSLVGVGVDKKGWDLHYGPKKITKADAAMPGGQAIPTMSLTGEYVTPPPPPPPGAAGHLDISAGAEREKTVFDERFVLLNLARKQCPDLDI